jgi:hypothetical protein
MPKCPPKPLPFEALLDVAGATFDYRIAEYGQGCASTDMYNFRYNVDEVQIAVKARFDRWANSGDFLCRPLPDTQEDFDALMLALKKVLDEKREAPEFGGFDIWPFVRQARRAMRNNERLARRDPRAADPTPLDNRIA